MENKDVKEMAEVLTKSLDDTQKNAINTEKLVQQVCNMSGQENHNQVIAGIIADEGTNWEKKVDLIRIANAEYDREVFMKEFNADDLQNFNGTAWKYINAVSGYFYFKPPTRVTSTYEDKRMSTLIIPDKKLDEMYALVAA